MLKKTVTYTDYNGMERTEDFFFNLTQAELMDMQWSEAGGLMERIKKIMMTKDFPELMKLFKGLVIAAYGEKSADGRRFEKTDKLREEFQQTPAFSKIYMELATDDVAGSEFVNGIMPDDMPKSTITREQVEAYLKDPNMPLPGVQ